MAELKDTVEIISQLREQMVEKINVVIRDFEETTALVVTGMHIDMSRRLACAKFSSQYPNALQNNDVDVRLIEFTVNDSDLKKSVSIA